MNIIPFKTRAFKEGENLLDFIREHVETIENRDVLVVTSKIVALSQGRTAIEVSNKKLIVVQEAERVIETAYGTLTEVDGRWCVNAGVDESNASGKLVLLPTNIDVEADRLHAKLLSIYQLNDFGIVITDSRSLPLRTGVMSSSLASAGIKQLRSYIGKEDLDGRLMKYTQLNVVDSLAAAGGLVMGEGNESTPLVLIKDAPVEFTRATTPGRDLCIPPAEDLYAALYKSQDI